MQPLQLPLFSSSDTRFDYPFPPTRYQGSKQKWVGWIWENTQHLEFTTVLDVFGGTGAVSHLFKRVGKQVTYNDALAFNHEIGLALIENHDQTLATPMIEVLLDTDDPLAYPTFIEQTFPNIYYTDAENQWLDRMVYRIDHLLANPYQQAIARFALFQACIIKRPYNLFHRANLYMRTAPVERTFGNKTTWDTPFPSHFKTFAQQANLAVFDNRQPNTAIQCDALETPTGFDLVYLDPPYINHHGVGVDYRDFYHFLEGMMNYSQWNQQVDYESKHRRLKPQKSAWNDPHTIIEVFESLIERHHKSILIVSYRDDGIPSHHDLVKVLRRFKKEVYLASQPTQYVLSQKRSHELLLIAP